MSKVHVLTASDGEYQIAVHFAMPGGTNTAGVTWKDAWVNSGRATTQLPEGTGPGQILSAEKTDVEAGDVVEITGTFRVDTGGSTNQEIVAAIDVAADAAIATATSRLSAALKYFGHAQD